MPAISSSVIQSVNQYIKLTPLREIPKYQGRILDENDLIEALDITLQSLKETERMLDKPMYAGEKAFDFVEDAKRALEEVYLSSRETKDVMMQRRKHLIMYHLVVEPVIEDLGNCDHRLMLQCVEGYINALKHYILESDIEVQMDDAVVMLEIVKARIRQREELRKLNIRKRKTVKRIEPIPSEGDVQFDIE